MVLASTSPTGVAIAVVLLYFAPAIIGAMRKVPSLGSVCVVNFFLGWTLIGWVVALAMAARSVPTPSSQPSTTGYPHEQIPTGRSVQPRRDRLPWS